VGPLPRVIVVATMCSAVTNVDPKDRIAATIVVAHPECRPTPRPPSHGCRNGPVRRGPGRAVVVVTDRPAVAAAATIRARNGFENPSR
jgi:hypothetical protein